MSSAFSSSETDVLQRNVDAQNSTSTPLDQVQIVYEVDKCVAWIKRKNVEKVALQFPDEMLSDSANVARLIENILNRKVYILGDSSYGSCCVDEIAAEHAGCDAVIHFGRSCLSPTKKLPVLHIFTPLRCAFAVGFMKLLDSGNYGGLIEAFEENFQDPSSTLLLAYDISVASLMKKIVQILSSRFTSLIVTQLCVDTGQEKELEKCGPFCQLSGKRCHSCTCLGRSFCLPVSVKNEDPRIIPPLIFFGEDNITLDNLSLTLRGHDCFRCYVKDDGGFTVQPRKLDCTNRFLRRRLFLIEKVREAKVFGVVVGTLGRDGFLESAEHVMSTIRAHGRKSYLLAVGRPTPPKLANFLEIEVFVVIACPESARQLDVRGEYHRPIVTPYEIEVAFSVSSNVSDKSTPRRWEEWGGLDFIPDFLEFLPGGICYSDVHASEMNYPSGDITDVSLLSGKIRQVGLSSGETSGNEPSESSNCTDVAVRNDMSLDVVHKGGGGEFLAGRSWRGLEMNHGESLSPSSIHLGRIGTASGYKSEENTIGCVDEGCESK